MVKSKIALLHIGDFKTGTKSIQNFIQINRDNFASFDISSLDDDNITIINSDSSIFFQLAFSNEKIINSTPSLKSCALDLVNEKNIPVVESFVKSAKEYCQNTLQEFLFRSRNVVLSGEGISIIDPVNLQDLVNKFDENGYSLYILQYTRNPIDFTISSAKFQISEGLNPLLPNIFYDGTFSSAVLYPRLPLNIDGDLVRSFLSQLPSINFIQQEYSDAIEHIGDIVDNWIHYILKIFKLNPSTAFVSQSKKINKSISNFASDMALYLNQQFNIFLPKRLIEANFELVEAFTEPVSYIYDLDRKYLPFWFNSDVWHYVYYRYYDETQSISLEQKHKYDSLFHFSQSYWLDLDLHRVCSDFLFAVFFNKDGIIDFFRHNLLAVNDKNNNLHHFLVNLLLLWSLCKENYLSNTILLESLNSDELHHRLDFAINSLLILSDEIPNSVFSRYLELLCGPYTDPTFAAFMNVDRSDSFHFDINKLSETQTISQDSVAAVKLLTNIKINPT